MRRVGAKHSGAKHFDAKHSNTKHANAGEQRARSRSARRVRAAAAGLLVLVVVGGLIAAGVHGGYSATRSRMLSGSVWLASAQPGQLTLLDGASAEVAAQVQVAPKGNRLDVVQQGSTAYAVDSTAATIRRVDGATFDTSPPASPLPDAKDSLRAFAGPDALYVLDTKRGVLVDTDPKTLAARRGPVLLAAQVTDQAAAIDDTGRLWVVDNTTGDLVWIAKGQHRTRRAATARGAGLLTIADGGPVLVDTSRRTATTVDPTSGATTHTIELDLRPDDRVQVSGSPHAPRLYVVAARGVLAICDLTAANCSTAVPLGTASSDLGAAVEASGRLFVPDYGTGRVWIVDLRSSRVIGQSQIAKPGTHFELLARDGLVFFNEPNSERAGVLRSSGELNLVAKYDPLEPGKGLTGGTNGNGLPGSTPTKPPSKPDQPPNNASDNKPITPGQPPPNNPGQPPPGPQPQPEPGQSPSPSPSPQPPAVPEVQIAFSNTAPLAGDTVVLEAQRKGAGTQPTAATWTFGDGQTGNGVQTSHQWAAARTYQVTVTATFPDGQTAVASEGIQVTALPQLTVTAPANGTVSGGGISCPGTCTATYSPGQGVTLNATPNSGFVFTGWGGNCGGKGTCSLTMDGNKNVSATFGAQHTLTVSVSGGGSVGGGGINCPGTCSVTVDPGTSITLQANAGSGNGLLNWGGSCGNGRNTTCTVRMDVDRSVSATFAQLPGVTVDVGSGGHITGTVPCPELTTCGPVRFPFGRTVTLHAVFDNANRVGWDGACNNSTSTTCSFSVGTQPGSVTLVQVNFTIADPCPPVCGPPAVNGRNAGRAGARGPLEPARLPDPPDPLPARRRRRRARPGRG